MILSNEQERAIKIASDNFKHGVNITTIGGYAGSGKTTLIKYFIEENDLMSSTHFCTYTGKAALILQQKGLPATTIHKLIYQTIVNHRTGEFRFLRKAKLSDHVKLIVVDEISMVPKDLLNDLQRYGVPIIALGDPGQLEPIGDTDNLLLKNPDIFLKEIHRQALGNSIIRLSMDIREGKPLKLIDNDPHIKIVKKDEVHFEMLNWADQILVSRNATRHGINDHMRKELGFSGEYPMVGEKMICLRNYWKKSNSDGYALTNGATGTVQSTKTLSQYFYPNTTLIDFLPDFSDGVFDKLKLNGKVLKREGNVYQKGKKIFDFDFGYAITVHKSQGSQFPKVFVFNETLPHTDHKRLLYTAVTRAEDQLVLAI